MNILELSEQEIIRRNSLNELRAMGIDPYPAAEYVTNDFSTEIKDEFKDEENFVEMLKRIITEIRNTRAKMNVHPSKKADLIFVTEKYESKIKEAKEFLLKLGFGNDIIIQENKTGIKEDAISILEDGIELYIPFEGLVDMEQERKRLEEEKKRLKSEVARCEKMLSNPGFMNKAPQSKIEEEQAKLQKYKEMLAKLEK